MVLSVQDEFVENARLLIFETYCRIHQCIDLGMLAEKLNMETSAAETWVVNLIRNARLNAKIDSQVCTSQPLLLPAAIASGTRVNFV